MIEEIGVNLFHLEVDEEEEIVVLDPEAQVAINAAHRVNGWLTQWEAKGSKDKPTKLFGLVIPPAVDTFTRPVKVAEKTKRVRLDYGVGGSAIVLVKLKEKGEKKWWEAVGIQFTYFSPFFRQTVTCEVKEWAMTLLVYSRPEETKQFSVEIVDDIANSVKVEEVPGEE